MCSTGVKNKPNWIRLREFKVGLMDAVREYLFLFIFFIAIILSNSRVQRELDISNLPYKSFNYNLFFFNISCKM